MYKFWMVIKASGAGSGSTQKRHGTENSARDEAERLARQYPGEEFVILEAKYIVGIPQQPVSFRPVV